MKLTLAKQAWQNFWQMRDARERKMLLSAVVVVIAALMYGLLLSPALTARAQLAKALPLLHEQVAAMQALSNQAASLPQQTAAPAMSKETLTAALITHGLKAADLSMMNDNAQLQLKAASFAQTLAFLNDIQKSAHIVVSEAKITALATPDQIDASFTLHQAEQP